MGRVQSSLVLNDQMSRVLGRINKAMGSVLDSFEAVQRASGRSFNTANIAAARREIGAADAALNEMEQSYRDCNNQQQQLNRHIGQGTSAAGGLLGKIKSIASAYLGMKTVTGLVGLSDTITQTDARLSMMNDGLQTTAELNDMIYASAQRSRGSYLATADAVAKLGLMAGDAFSSNKETIAFMEQVNKQFKIAGTSAAGIDAAMLQLTQAMGSGVLRGEEYNSILEQAPNIIQAIAKYLDVPKGQLKEMAADGKITADIVKAAMFGSDANWGRILCALGYSGVDIDVHRVDVKFSSDGGEIEVCKDGSGIDFSEELAKKVLSCDEVYILVDLKSGASCATAYGCDLTYDYVKINGDYRT